MLAHVPPSLPCQHTQALRFRRQPPHAFGLIAVDGVPTLGPSIARDVAGMKECSGNTRAFQCSNSVL